MSKHYITSRFLDIDIKSSTLTLNVSIYFLLIMNSAFWQSYIDTLDAFSFANIIFSFSLLVFLVIATNLILLLFSFKYLLKPLLIILLLSSALVSYFMSTYGIMIDKTMIQNVAETNPGESLELLSPALLLHFCILGLLPALVVYKARIHFDTLPKELLSRLWIVLGSVALIAVILLVHYKDFVSLSREHRHLRHLINPINYVYSLASYAGNTLYAADNTIHPIGTDAHVVLPANNNSKHSLVVLVVGETARARNFSLNGYSRDTNPWMRRENIINFSNAWSCGTNTAVSVPCMFSHLDHNHYDDDKAKHSENVLDVLKHAGVNVLWRENDSGCKGVCERVEQESMIHMNIAEVCNTEECHDEILLNHLQDRIESLEKDTVIVLHQKGSHGPAYGKRYPENFNVYTPTCNTNTLSDCSQQDVINAYDNTILYTDYFLEQVISFLKKNSAQFNAAMIYASDHGESLGENNLYLHGMPYMFAPDEQKHIPFMMWLSQDIEMNNDISDACLRTHSANEYSHDNLFHSLLGLMNVQTSSYDPSLDIFSSCRTLAQTAVNTKSAVGNTR
ncbi:MAG TPA: phosphoethanolamine--lipid A transferase [Gammaproteobacteria bacterium]